THGCHRGCVIQCSGIFNDKDGNYVTKQPEYETLWSHGGYCGITDLDAIARLDRLDDDLGLDTIETGVTVGVLMDAGKIAWGDADAAVSVVEEIGKGTELGRLYGSGATAVAKHLGVERVPAVKGQAFSAYDGRALKGLGVTYATSPMGADHTAGHTLANHVGKVDPKIPGLASEGQWMTSALAQIASAAIDATGYCLMVGFASMDKPEFAKHLLDSMAAFTGNHWHEGSFVALGMRTLRLEVDFNRRAGFTEEDDRLPEWMTTEALPPHNAVFDVPREDLAKVHDQTGLIMTLFAGVTTSFAPPISVFNQGCYKMIPSYLDALGVKKALLVTGHRAVAKAGLLKLVTDALDAKLIPYAVFNGVDPDPTVHNVDAGLDVYRREGCNGIISIGGGSPHDCAKAIGMLATNPGRLIDYLGLFSLVNPIPPLICVNTTAGTGSEASIGAIITDAERGHKMLLADPKLLPIVAVNDPLFTQPMPPSITAATGIDALAHAVEAFSSVLSNPLCEGLALEAVRLIAENLPLACANGDDLKARSNMAYAAYMAGVAMNSGLLGNSHSLAHALGAVYHLPHGDCNALVLPEVMRKNKAAIAGKLVRIAGAMGVNTAGMTEDQAAEAACDAVKALVLKIGGPASVTDLGGRNGRTVNRADIAALVEHASHDPCCSPNPLPYALKDFAEIYEKVWE
ncbi:MAG: iron-containing alcohol dehydrogenase, partial [Deltaproteobacteria bacterium]|nr:iron-containing alcohol dehydrogenase [Deltaproteobacteria bacterium]